jgi:hypothetical protein
MATNTFATEHWPGWAKALVIGQFALIVAVLVPWVFMSVMCMGMGNMWQMMETMPGR